MRSGRVLLERLKLLSWSRKVKLLLDPKVYYRPQDPATGARTGTDESRFNEIQGKSNIMSLCCVISAMRLVLQQGIFICNK
jgi:hypothetical protein